MRYWELDETGQPTQKIIERRRSAKFITPIPKPKKRKAAAQSGFVFDEGKGLSTNEQQYDATSIINEARGHLDAWRCLHNPNQWQVTPETTRPGLSMRSRAGITTMRVTTSGRQVTGS